jgi:lysophospholipase L1-like esterase
MKKYFFLSLIFWLSQTTFGQQKNIFWPAVQKFKTQDSLEAPASGQILLLGSSTLEYWKNAIQDLDGYPVINRGIAGTKMSDVIELYDDWMLATRPAMILVYEGDNDLALTTKTSEQIAQEYAQFRKRVARDFPETVVVFYSVKPSVARQALLPKQVELNNLLKKMAKKMKKTKYLDTFSALVNGHEKPLKDIFVADNLHLNEKGYVIWAGITRQFLAKNWPIKKAEK